MSTLVFEQLKDSIFRGQLITMGYLKTRQGKGTFVVDRDVSDTNNPFASIISPGKSTVNELLEFRIGLGLHGSTLAAELVTASVFFCNNKKPLKTKRSF